MRREDVPPPSVRAEAGRASAVATSQPNIVLIMTDQHRADFFASEGFPVDTMPFVDALGRQGTRFARAYTPMPTCTPARTSARPAVVVV
ncbi:sulfatase-like hydrolase/transferase, partial [Mycobacterium tuberculosis]|nr:sulfatase-like hydrolase/transferase [Mycobacterium tuberculosis]